LTTTGLSQAERLNAASAAVISIERFMVHPPEVERVGERRLRGVGEHGTET
jgi:hypothetical protein